MKSVRCLLAAVAVVSLCELLLPRAAQAQGPVSVYYGLNSPFHADSARISMYTSGLVPTPPYFALHPPVYYSCPVPRSYGYSPYAYPSYVMTPEAAPAPAKPVMYKNPYVDQDAPAQNTQDKPATPTPRRTAAAPTPELNPYVAQPASQVVSRQQ